MSGTRGQSHNTPRVTPQRHTGMPGALDAHRIMTTARAALSSVVCDDIVKILNATVLHAIQCEPINTPCASCGCVVESRVRQCTVATAPEKRAIEQVGGNIFPEVLRRTRGGGSMCSAHYGPKVASAAKYKIILPQKNKVYCIKQKNGNASSRCCMGAC